jgi:hypothetical protein
MVRKRRAITGVLIAEDDFHAIIVRIEGVGKVSPVGGEIDLHHTIDIQIFSSACFWGYSPGGEWK